MIGWYIAGGITLLIVILLSLPVVFEINYKKQAEIKIRLLFFDLLTEKRLNRKKKIKKRIKKRVKKRIAKVSSTTEPAYNQPSQPPPQTQQTTLKPPKKKKLNKNIPDLDINLIKMLISSMAHPFRKLIKKIKITELRIDSIAGGSDAAKAALNYGAQNAVIHGTIAWLKEISSVKVERINIQPDFMREDSEFTLHCKVRIKIGTVIVCGLAFIFKFIALNSNGNGNEHYTKKPQRAGVGKTIRIVMD
jgi:hypothetical protein